MSTSDDDRVMISALQHYAYCPRQCALIHVEQIYEENLYTLRGNRVHERVDEPTTERRGDLRIERAVPLWSERLGLVGRADVIEYRDGTPYPVEYKQGKKRHRRAARIQLCAQALCLEEMHETHVPAGALFHAGSQRRDEVEFTESLRSRTEEIARHVHHLLADNRVPRPVNDARCRHCSLKKACLPASVANKSHTTKMQAALFTIDE